MGLLPHSLPHFGWDFGEHNATACNTSFLKAPVMTEQLATVWGTNLRCATFSMVSLGRTNILKQRLVNLENYHLGA